MADLVLGLGVALVQLILGLVLAVVSIYIGMWSFGRMTKGIDEMAELRKGNVAVGILMAAVIFSIATVVQSGVSGITNGLKPGLTIDQLVSVLGVGILQLLVGIVVAVIAIYLAINALDKITTEINEKAELKKGNVAVAIIMAGVLLAVSFVVQAGVSGISKAIGLGF